MTETWTATCVAHTSEGNVTDGVQSCYTTSVYYRELAMHYDRDTDTYSLECEVTEQQSIDTGCGPCVAITV